MRIQDLTLGLLPVSPITGQQTANSTLMKQAKYFRGRIFSREDIFARGYFREKIFSREDIFTWTVYSRKYLLAKIFKIHFSRNFLPAKIKCYTVFRFRVFIAILLHQSQFTIIISILSMGTRMMDLLYSFLPLELIPMRSAGVSVPL